MKSSAQRQIRAKVLEQIPFLAHPAVAPAPSAPVEPSTAAAAAAAAEASDSEDDGAGKRKKGAGKDKRGGGGGKKGGNKKGGKRDDHAAAAAPVDVAPQAQPAGAADSTAEDEALTVLDLIWPKKETLSLVKWSVLPAPCLLGRATKDLRTHAAGITSRFTPSTANRSFSNISTARSTRPSRSCIAVSSRHAKNRGARTSSHGVVGITTPQRLESRARGHVSPSDRYRGAFTRRLSSLPRYT